MVEFESVACVWVRGRAAVRSGDGIVRGGRTGLERGGRKPRSKPDLPGTKTLARACSTDSAALVAYRLIDCVAILMARLVVSYVPSFRVLSNVKLELCQVLREYRRGAQG